jgi:hypothetical protein
MMRQLGIYQRDGKWIEPERVIGIVNKPTMPFSQPAPRCADFRHQPPVGLYVESGDTYVHECPSCDYKKTIVGQLVQNYAFNEDEDADAFSAESDNEILDKLGR